jgi:hypothetical protein
VIAVAPPFPPPPPPPPPHALLAARSLGKLLCSPVSYCFSRCFVEEKLGKKRRREACVRVCAFLCVCGIGISLSRVHAPAVGRSFLLARARSLSLSLFIVLSLSLARSLSLFSLAKVVREICLATCLRGMEVCKHTQTHTHTATDTQAHTCSLHSEMNGRLFQNFVEVPDSAH